MEGGGRVMQELISSCYRAQERFRSAAALAHDGTLKKLFEIHAQQRTRFAEELREHLPGQETARWQDDESAGNGNAIGGDSMRSCLDSDSRTLQLYKEALASHELPTRTHFLIASQLALLERAHERVSSLLGEGTVPATHIAPPTRIRA